MKVNSRSSEPISLESGTVEEVQDFIYFGSNISTNGGADKDVELCINKARHAFRTLHPVWLSSQLSINTKIRIFNTNIKPDLLYGCEMWKTTQSLNNKLQVFINSRLRYNLKPLINGVEIVVKDLKTLGGLVHGINGLLEPRLNRCDQMSTITVWGDCVPCSEVPPCPPGFTPSIPRVISYSCRSNIGSMSGDQLTGCKTQCQKNFLKPRCCNGFVQPDCKDPCQINNGGCHASARCHVDGNHVTCSCTLGYVGDGYDCKSTCDLYNGGCHFLANCSVNGKDGSVQCKCPQGFHGSGWQCFAAYNPCEIENGGCSPYATCDYLVPQVLCTCKDPFVGNGTMCNSDILHTLSVMPQTSIFYKMLKAADAKTASRAAHLLELLVSPTQNLTVFVPVNNAFKAHQVQQLNQSCCQVQQLNVVTLENHVVAGRVYLFPAEVQNGTQLVTLLNMQLTLLWQRVTQGKGYFQINGIEVVETNIPAINGVLHLIAAPLIDKHNIQVGIE
ncbi:hypothetical protein LSAT2_031374 [Lamellibrachia satsuma]|nr:hypothetical protein LSAT2_031374 [Lamellibrachia satsuma]